MTQTEDIIDEGAEHKTWKGKLWGVIKVILIIAVTGGCFTMYSVRFRLRKLNIA
ncbi:hypothetical protein ACQ86K_24890 [Mucilaginibacter sp. P19]|uniref:hypothetical protein n=1 Tax=Mucilaginibacter sp. P19 TaxID=3423947 RepID=UPI003D666C1A